MSRFWVACLLLLAPLTGMADPVVTLGVLAKRGDERALERWRPTAGYLDRAIPDRDFRVRPLAFDEIQPAVRGGEVDFILANPAIYVQLEHRYKASRIVTLRNRVEGRVYRRFGGVLFTRSDPEAPTDLADLAGADFAAVAETSLGGYLMGLKVLRDAGFEPAQDAARLRFMGTHDRVVEAVLSGKADAGTVRTDTLERMAQQGRIRPDDYRILHPVAHEGFPLAVSTPLYPEWPLAKLAHTSDRLAHKVATALMAIPAEDPAAREGDYAGWTVPGNYQSVHELLKALQKPPFEPTTPTLERIVRAYWEWLVAILIGLIGVLAGAAYVTDLNRRLRQQEEALRRSRDELEERVRERTAELEASRREAELARRDWNDAFDAITDPIFIHDEDLRIIQANPAYAAEAGMDREELPGRIYWEVLPRLDGPLEACQAFPERMQQDRQEIRLPNGKVFLNRSFGVSHADPQRGHDAIHILEDVTEERRAQSQRKRLSRAVEQAREAMVITDPDGTIRYANPAFRALSGLEAQQLEGRSLADCWPADEPSLKSVLRQAAGAGWSGEMDLSAQSGPAVPVFATASVIPDSEETGAGEDVAGYVLTMLDQRAVKRSQAALRYRYRFEQLISGIARRFVQAGSEDLDTEIDEALAQLGRFLGVDRVHLCEFEDSGDRVARDHHWCREGVDCTGIDLQGQLLSDRLPWFAARIRAQKVVQFPDVDALPPEAEQEREILSRAASLSILGVPLVYAEEVMGFMGFHAVSQNREWTLADLQLLQASGEIMANALKRAEAEETVRRRQEELAEAQHIARLGNWVWDIRANELAWSDEIYRIFGVTPQSFGGTYDAFLGYVHPEDREKVQENVDRALAGEAEYAIDHRVVRPDGEVRIVHEQAVVDRDDQGEPVRMIGTVQDVTENREAERELRRLNRSLQTLSLANQKLVRATNEQQLLEEVCQILVGSGGYRLAWVGMAEADGEKGVRPVAYSGADPDEPEQPIGWGRSGAVQGPAGEAVRSGQAVIVGELASEKRFADWRVEAGQRGYGALAALPLWVADEPVGVLTVVTDETGPFDSEELQLLKELASDLAFGIHAIRAREEQRRFQAALEASEARYQDLFDHAPVAFLSFRPEDATPFQANEALAELVGYDPDQTPVNVLFPPGEEGQERFRQLLARVRRGQPVRGPELRMQRGDGEQRWVSLFLDPVTDGGDEDVTEVRMAALDVTPRRQAEKEQQEMAARLERALFQTIQAMAMTIEKRDPYTAGHQTRVTRLALAIADRLGLDPDRREGLRLAALIHDIGKVYVPAEILNRPGKLTDTEFDLIRTHPQQGYEILAAIEFPWPVAEIVKQHHERLDGSGYPEGLEGDELLLEARILAVADTVEAMVSHRPYRPGKSLETALAVIEEDKETKYDPQVVAACQALFREGAFDWEEEREGEVKGSEGVPALSPSAGP